MELAPRESPFAPPTVPPPPLDAPRVTGVDDDRLGAALHTSGRGARRRTTLVATLTTAVDTMPEGQKKLRHGGLVSVRPFDARGKADSALRRC